MKTALLAGTHSGCGKTTLMLALLQYSRQQTNKVAAFKSGPDFLDPLWHQAITGTPSYNLDTKMMGVETCQSVFYQQSQQADIGLIEGVMGLFDGHEGVGKAGSSLDLARILDCPVLLVVDASGMAGTIAAVVTGFYQLAAQQNVRISGVIANKVGSLYHAEILQNALQAYQLPPLIAWMKNSDKVLGERHLGLKMPDEASVPDYLASLHINDDALKQAFSEKTPTIPNVSHQQALLNKTIAIAKDAACCFIYPANVDWLINQGAKLVYFSPVAGEAVPNGVDAIWLPGGYPELYAEQLSKSKTWASLWACVDAGLPILAECGGAMMLGKSLIDITGKEWPMAGVFPYTSIMQRNLQALGYREEASGVKGHEFHYSKRAEDHGLTQAFNVSQGDKGIRYNNTRASYVHWYFSTDSGEAVAWFCMD